MHLILRIPVVGTTLLIVVYMQISQRFNEWWQVGKDKIKQTKYEK